jgi:hypothetical protein
MDGSKLIQNPLDPIHRHLLAGRPAAPAIDDPYRPMRRKSVAQPAKMSFAHPSAGVSINLRLTEPLARSRNSSAASTRLSPIARSHP